METCPTTQFLDPQLRRLRLHRARRRRSPVAMKRLAENHRTTTHSSRAARRGPDCSDRAGTRVWHLAPGAGAGPCRHRLQPWDAGSTSAPAFVLLGATARWQNYALIYEPAVLEDGGVRRSRPVVFTNDVVPAGRQSGFEPSRLPATGTRSVVHVARARPSAPGQSASLPVSIGRWALVAAGAGGDDGCPDHALVAGVPARRIGWVGRAGVPLRP